MWPIDDADFTVNASPSGEPKVGKSFHDVNKSLSEMVMKETQRVETVTTEKTLKVKSNFARDRVVLLTSGYALKFDGSGIAHLPTSQLSALNVEMKARPGRFCVIPEEGKQEPVPVVDEVSSSGSEPAEQSVAEETEVIKEKPETSFKMEKFVRTGARVGRPAKRKIKENVDGES